MKIALSALLTALVIGLVSGPFLIMLLRYLKFGQTIRAEGPARHFQKAGTPTMGGLIFLLAFVISALIWGEGSQTMAILVVTTLLYGAIGFIDDGIIILKHRSLGLTAKQKLVMQFLFAFVFIYLVSVGMGRGTDLIVPLVDVQLELGIFYYIIMSVFMVFMVNAVNLTDGLDGLAGGTTFLVLLGYMIIALISVKNPPVSGVNYQDMAIGIAALAGGCLAFLFYNRYPAKVFMGDTGSLALGGALMSLAIMTKTEVVFVIIGLIFLVEALSVVLQVTSFKLTGKRIFKMSPLHHHFEMCGWSEIKIVTTFWAVTAFCVMLGLLLLTF